VVLPDHSLRGGTQEEVQVNNTTNHPAGAEGGGGAGQHSSQEGSTDDLTR
jgi:hypothetical protein